jgi:hypothetical protein
MLREWGVERPKDAPDPADRVDGPRADDSDDVVSLPPTIVTSAPLSNVQ